MEWVSNFTIGTGEHSENMHEGFYISSDIILKCINEYLTKYDLKENIKLWMSGYSRGAAVTNIAAGRIDMDMINGVKTFDNGAKLNKADMYVYTFETPMGAPKNMDVDSEKFNNVFNIIYPYDVITHVAMSNLGFDRFGIDINIPVEGTAGYNEKLSKMLGIYNNMADGGPCVEFKINDFKMHKISNSFPYISVDKSKSDWRMNDLSKDFTRLLSKGLGDDRTIYYRDVQNPINNIFRIVFEDNPDGTCILIGQAIGTEILNVYSILELPELIDTIRNGSTDDIYNALHEAVVNAISKLQPKSVSADELTMALSEMIVSIRDVVKNSEDPNALINDLVSMSVNSSFESQFMTSISPHYPPMILAWLISQDENY